MSDYEKHDWIVTTIEVRYIDGSTRLIRLSPGENYRDAAGEGLDFSLYYQIAVWCV